MDIKDMFRLFDKFDKSSLSELKVKEGESELVLKKGSAVPLAGPEHPALSPAPGDSLPKPAPQASPAVAGSVTPEKKTTPGDNNHRDVITSPIVGTFYRAPSPDSPPFVDEGDKVKQGQTLCIIEAMKVMNELEVEFDCKVDKILTESGAMVEYGTPLFEVIKQ